MQGPVSDDEVTIYFGINRASLEVQRVTASVDGTLSAPQAGDTPRIIHCGSRSDPETEVILQFGLIEIFSMPKRSQRFPLGASPN